MLSTFHTLYTAIFYQPLFNLLIFLYNVIPGNDLGIAIILLTLLLKLVLAPFSLQSIRSQRALQALQPKLKQLQVLHAKDKEALARETMKLYKTEKVHPFSSCLPVLIQLPFLIAVYQVFRSGLLSQNFDLLYTFLYHPTAIKTISFGFLDLTKTNMVLPVLAGLAQWWQTKMLIKTKPPVKTEGAKDEAMMATMNRQMMYVMPAMTVLIGLRLPSGLALYWLVVTLLTVLQQWYYFRKGEPSAV